MANAGPPKGLQHQNNLVLCYDKKENKDYETVDVPECQFIMNTKKNHVLDITYIELSDSSIADPEQNPKTYHMELTNITLGMNYRILFFFSDPPVPSVPSVPSDISKQQVYKYIDAKCT